MISFRFAPAIIYFLPVNLDFFPRKSTTLQLLKYRDFIASNVSKGEQIDSIYLDYSKAFDCVVHSKVLYKLSCIGITGKLLSWIESFLTGRFQCVKVGETLSNCSPAIRGIPQGSVLGPILFVFNYK